MTEQTGDPNRFDFDDVDAANVNIPSINADQEDAPRLDEARFSRLAGAARTTRTDEEARGYERGDARKIKRDEYWDEELTPETGYGWRGGNAGVRERVGAFVSDAMRRDRRIGRPLSYSTLNVSDEERLWAGLAHGSVAFTLLVGLLSGGFMLPISILFPLVLYFVFRTRSDFVAFHALQAFVLALVSTVGLGLLWIVGSILWVIGFLVSALLILVLIGIVLIFVWLLVGLVGGLAMLALPVGVFVISLIAAFQTYAGRDYRYPFIAPWVDQQMASGFMRG